MTINKKTSGILDELIKIMLSSYWFLICFAKVRHASIIRL